MTVPMIEMRSVFLAVAPLFRTQQEPTLIDMGLGIPIEVWIVEADILHNRLLAQTFWEHDQPV